MTRRDPETKRLLAGEYALGLLRGPARESFERLRLSDDELDREAVAWERRLNALAEGAPEMAPPAKVWRAIEAATKPPAPACDSLWNRVGFWRGFGLAAATAAAGLLALVLTGPQRDIPVPPAFQGGHVAVLAGEDKQPAWLVRADLGTGRAVVESLRVAAVPGDRSLELWIITGADKPPQSLGLLPAAGGTIEVSLAHVTPGERAGAAAFAVSLEPAGGSPTKLPTGPILYVGPVVQTTL